MASDVSLGIPHPCLIFQVREGSLCVNLSEANRVRKRNRVEERDDIQSVRGGYPFHRQFSFSRPGFIPRREKD